MKKLIDRPFLTTLILLLGTVCGLKAQETDDFTFTHIGQADGIHSMRIYTILQTDDGAIWWATKNGIERYNGVTIRYYQPGEKQILSNQAGRYFKLTFWHHHKEKTTKEEDLMAFDNKGAIFLYDPATGHYQTYADIGRQLQSNEQVNALCAIDSTIWIATSKGVYRYQGQQLTPIVKNAYSSFIIKTSWNLLFCTKDGVLQYSFAKPNKPLRNIAPHNMESGFYDPLYNKVWLGGYKGELYVLSYNKRGNAMKNDFVQYDKNIVSNPIRSIFPYDEHTMLVGIDGHGVYQVTRHPDATGNYHGSILFDANEGPHDVLHGNGIYSLIRDSWGNIIIGSYSGGIDIARPVGSTAAVFRHLRNDQQSIRNDHVNSVMQLSDNLLAMGTDNGVSMFNTQTRSWTHCCGGTVVLSLCKMPDGNILASTYGKGVFEFNTNGQARQVYSEAIGTLQDDHVFKLLYDRRGNLWMGCLDGQLVQKSAAGVRYHPVNFVNDLLELPDGRMVAATAYGVWTVDPATGHVEELKYHATPKEDVNRFVSTLFLHKGNQLWMGTDGGGIYIYDLHSRQCTQLTKENGLPSNSVRSIIKDHYGRLMVATEQGVAFIRPEKPTQAIDINYCYGLGCEYTNGAAANMADGRLLFGTTSGALIVNPENIQEINYVAPLRLTAISCSESDESFQKNSYRMLCDHDIRLSYDQRTFDLHFESINLRNQYDIVYQYQVGNGAWSKPSPQQYIRFTNMETGHHKLLIRSVSRTSGAVLDEVSLSIAIGNPWWKSWWMRCLYGTLLILAFYGAWRIYQLHTKYMRLVINSPSLSANLNIPVGANAVQESAEEQPQEGSEFINQVTRLILENITDSDFSIDRLCREMAMSRTLFYVKLKSYTGKSPQDFIRIIRLERAAAFLRNGRPVTDVAALTGFDNPKYFSTVFKKYFGVSPSKYK